MLPIVNMIRHVMAMIISVMLKAGFANNSPQELVNARMPALDQAIAKTRYPVIQLAIMNFVELQAIRPVWKSLQQKLILADNSE